MCMCVDFYRSNLLFDYCADDKYKDDERFLFVVSDANFRRYGMSPVEFADILSSAEPAVQTTALLISSADEARSLRAALPEGVASVCTETKELVSYMVQRLTGALRTKKTSL